MNRAELYKKLDEMGYAVYKVGGIYALQMPTKGSGYLEIYPERIEERTPGHGTLLQSKSYKDFEELIEILSELNAERKPKQIFKEYCNVLGKLCYISENFEEEIMQDLAQMCEKYTKLANDVKK